MRLVRPAAPLPLVLAFALAGCVNREVYAITASGAIYRIARQ
jgi:hypothetical protein